MNNDFLTYNALDSACTLEVHDAIWPDITPQGFTPAYQLTTDLFPVLTFMQTRGIKVDHTALEKTRDEIVASAATKQEELNQLCGRELNVNSSKDCQQYFYVELGIPPYYNEGSVTVDDLALQRMSRGTAKRSGLRQAKLVQEIRGLQKLHGTYLNIEFDGDGRMRCSYNPRGTKFGRLSSSKTIFGTGCVPPDAEVLTQAGWIRIDTWNPVFHIAQFDPISNDISFVKAGKHEEENSSGFMVVCNGEQIHQCLTPAHRVLYKPKLTGAFRESPAADVLNRDMTVIPLSGELRSGIYKPTAPKLLVMALADASFEWNTVRVAFKKARKITRFLALCKYYAIDVQEQAAHPGYRRFAFKKPTDWPKEKAWGDWILRLDEDSAKLMISEIGFWDGTIRGRSAVFYTADEVQANWVATLVHLHGMSATILSTEQSENSWSDTLMWRVNIKPRDYAYTFSKHWTTIEHSGKVYCPIVPSTYWIMRYKGKISITGNTNNQNLPQEFKKFLVADEGYVLWEVDKRQAEWVVMAYLTGDANMIRVIEEGKDTHIHTASLMFGAEPDLIEYENKLVGNNSDPDTIRSIRESDISLSKYADGFPRTMSARQCGKKSNHGLNYDEGFVKFALINEMEQSEGKRIVTMYHLIYPGIKVYYQTVQRLLQRDRALTNCFGRKVRFMDAWGPDLWKAAYSMLPQSSVVDSLNMGMVKTYKDDWLTHAQECNIDVLAQVHDSVLHQVPISVAASPRFQECITRVFDYCSPELNYNGRFFKIATDMKLGMNWGGYHKELNPTGMREVKDWNAAQLALGAMGVIQP